MNILLLGNGGREHAISQQINKSPLCSNLYIAPGNPGTAEYGQNIDIQVTEFSRILAFCQENQIDMVFVGPELPLVKGIYNFLTPHNIKVVGPSSEAAQLEGSKLYAKIFMTEMSIPTAAYNKFTIGTIHEAYKYIDKSKIPIVLKVDGLAGGKGVVILHDKEEAKEEIKSMLSGKFGNAGNNVVVEEFLSGIEFSVFVLTDGAEYKILPVAKDYKRIGENDTGLNTGGMGAVSPVPFVDDILMSKVEKNIIKPTIKGIQERKLNYKGFIFIGLIVVKGEPYVIEYNVRMGDPETEVVFPRIQSDIVKLFDSLFTGKLRQQDISISKKSATTVMLVSEGYPQKYPKGFEISGLENIKTSTIFQSGTTLTKNKLVTNGGRVMTITTLADDISAALDITYTNIEKIQFIGKTFRKDIGLDII